MEQHSPTAIAESEFARAMYAQLHAEINQRLDLRQGILTFTLLVAASLFGLGLQSWANAVTVLCYPILALFLAQVWAQHDQKIEQIAAYLRQIEDDLLGTYPGWERWRRQHFPVKPSHIELPARGVFLASDVLAMVIVLARFAGQSGSLMTTVLFVFLMAGDVAALVLTALTIQHQRQRERSLPAQREWTGGDRCEEKGDNDGYLHHD